MKLARAHNRSVGTSPFKHWKMNVHRWCCRLLCKLAQSLVGKPGPWLIFFSQVNPHPSLSKPFKVLRQGRPHNTQAQSQLSLASKQEHKYFTSFPTLPFLGSTRLHVFPYCFRVLMFCKLFIQSTVYLQYWPQLFKRWMTQLAPPNTYPLDSNLSGG